MGILTEVFNILSSMPKNRINRELNLMTLTNTFNTSEYFLSFYHYSTYISSYSKISNFKLSIDANIINFCQTQKSASLPGTRKSKIFK